MAGQTDKIIIKDPDLIMDNKKKVHLLDTSSDLYDDIALRMISKLKENNDKNKSTVFILPVGPRGQYVRFARRCNEENIPCSNLVTINMDEFLDENDNYFPESSPFSFRGFMKKNLFDLLEENVKIKPENIIFPDPVDPGRIYELLTNFKGADICFAGVGINGHIAFNEPLSEKQISAVEFKKLRTRILDLDKETIIMTSLKHGGHIEKIPGRCITIGIAEIMLSKEISIYLEHAHQAAIFEKILHYQQTPECPVTLLKDHPGFSLTITREVLDSFKKNN